MKEEVIVFWFRRDLRLNDNAGLYYALQSGIKVLPVFVFDTGILGKLADKRDRRVDFIHQVLHHLNSQLIEYGSSLLVYNGLVEAAFDDILKVFSVKKVVYNRDYEPLALKRDLKIESILREKGIACESYKDQCIFAENDILKKDLKPYTIFTPYMRKWKELALKYPVANYSNFTFNQNFFKLAPQSIPELSELGFQKTDIIYNPPKLNHNLIQLYQHNRDFPALNRTSKISIHLRFGTVSIREIVKAASVLSEAWLNELIWRDFYMMILFHFPHVVNSSFKKEFDFIEWKNNEDEFDKWCKGETGYPMVDAGMRELNATGFMHNRARMITASFLVKHLLIDWRWGEAYFAEKLNDFDLSANNGGWQWAAGTGCDAAPYFRIFNPTEQQKKFDPVFAYIKKWVPEFGTENYPEPIVEHAFARERALKTYKKALLLKSSVKNLDNQFIIYSY